MSAEGKRPKVVDTEDAPAAVGPYSQAIRWDGLLFCSGQIPLDPESGEIVGETLGHQTQRCLANLDAVCSSAGTSLDRALRLTVFTTRLDRFDEINEAWESYFAGQAAPARAAVGVSDLPRGAEVEIDAIVAC